MKSYNNFTGVGTVTRQPDYKQATEKAKSRATFTLVINRPYKHAEGDILKDYLQVVAYDKLADIINNYVMKDSLILLTGRVQTRSYEEGDQTRWITELVADSLNILEYPKKEK